MDDSLRFGFGDNWRRFLAELDEDRIAAAEESLGAMLGPASLAGRTFLDAGSGSGLFSLAARRLGARVHSFDYDPASVACTQELRRRYFPDDPAWTVEQGDILDRRYVEGLTPAEVVYSWGVLHHTGDLWAALANAAGLVAPSGTLFVAIYNDQGRASRVWTRVKRTYNQAPPALRQVILGASFLRLWGPTLARDLVRGHPLASWRNYRGVRGMSAWRDLVDWVGGYPFEVASPAAVRDFLRPRGFLPFKSVECGRGLGCNEFVLRRTQRPR
ncbi:MAG: class I SAM-dependent methyltransferase [Deltaproteobacteria bacterium]|nr:class I SAM-dependent methyltransferase [Deltaproteobacteria bacterium]